ncbi:MAG TPA: hypothetical protein VGY90_04010 [Steroidobacteraceae bacterium]|nr:hypothetical protein [Steroidobacteraceae bacterium]
MNDPPQMAPSTVSSSGVRQRAAGSASLLAAAVLVGSAARVFVVVHSEAGMGVRFRIA